MKFDLTFLLHPTSSEKTSCDKHLKCSMAKSSLSSLESNPVSHSDETDGGNDHHMMGTSMGTTRSTSIPLPSSHVPRTQSEVQLSIDEEAAEERDARMFYRLVNGIRERHQQQQTALDALHWQNSYEQSISRIVQARLTPLAKEGARLADQVPVATEPTKLSPEPDQVHHQDPSDAWSISGYEEEQQPQPGSVPFHLAHQPVDEDDEEGNSSPEEEGLFEMDL